MEGTNEIWYLWTEGVDQSNTMYALIQVTVLQQHSEMKFTVVKLTTLLVIMEKTRYIEWDLKGKYEFV